MPNSPFLDIILIAMVAAFILFRLYSVLGRRTGHEPPPKENYRVSSSAGSDNVVTLPERRAPAADNAGAKPADAVARGLLDIKLADRSFETDEFLGGAKSAYEMIVTAFANGDRATLQPLLSAEVFAAFDGVIRERESRKEKQIFTFVGFQDVKVVQAHLKGRTAEVTIAFGAQSISATSDAQGNLVQGDLKTVNDVTDVWTFSRDTRSRDPNWILVATSGAEA